MRIQKSLERKGRKGRKGGKESQSDESGRAFARQARLPA